MERKITRGEADALTITVAAMRTSAAALRTIARDLTNEASVHQVLGTPAVNYYDGEPGGRILAHPQKLLSVVQTIEHDAGAFEDHIANEADRLNREETETLAR